MFAFSTILGWSPGRISPAKPKQFRLLDNVLFYRTDGQKYSENTLNGAANTGTPVKTYYCLLYTSRCV